MNRQLLKEIFRRVHTDRQKRGQSTGKNTCEHTAEEAFGTDEDGMSRRRE
jgi:hypothetical protein